MNSTEKVLPAKRPPNLLFRRIFPTIGVLGLVITVAMNLTALLVFKRTSAEFLSHAWWSTWFPCYLVWMVFLLMGVAGLMIKRE